MEKTHWRKLKDTNYLGSWDVVDSQLILTIKELKTERVLSPDGKSEELPVMYWIEQYKPMIMNVTNLKAVEKATGSKFIEDWQGKKLAIYTTPVKAFGQTVDALRIKPNAPKTVKPNLEGPKYDSAVEKLKTGETTIETIEQYFTVTDAQKKYFETLVKK